MSEYKLTKEIIRLSEAASWGAAKLEWSLIDVYNSHEPDTCLCGHSPINEICTIKNRLNGKIATVGNSCVNKFLGLPSNKIFQAIRRVAKDNTKSLNVDAINYAHAKNWITDWERGFYLDTKGKRKLSEKQKAKRMEINERVTLKMQRSRVPNKKPFTVENEI